MSSALKIGALWLKESKKDPKVKFFAGEIDTGNGKIKVTIFRNGYKQDPKHPDYVVYLDTWKPEDEAKPKQAEIPAADDDFVDDIPF